MNPWIIDAVISNTKYDISVRLVNEVNGETRTLKLDQNTLSLLINLHNLQIEWWEDGYETGQLTAKRSDL